VATSDVRGSLSGALITKFTREELNFVTPKDLPLYNRFWDLTKNDDFAPEMEKSFFVPTNIFITSDQKVGKCHDPAQPCKTHSNCGDEIKSGWTRDGSGVRTGRCLRAGCEVKAWCPTERVPDLPSNTTAVLEGTKNFTLQISTHVQFHDFNLDWGIQTGSHKYKLCVRKFFRKIPSLVRPLENQLCSSVLRPSSVRQIHLPLFGHIERG
jgi:hypothetical protein